MYSDLRVGWYDGNKNQCRLMPGTKMQLQFWFLKTRFRKRVVLVVTLSERVGEKLLCGSCILYSRVTDAWKNQPACWKNHETYDWCLMFLFYSFRIRELSQTVCRLVNSLRLRIITGEMCSIFKTLDVSCFSNIIVSKCRFQTLWDNYLRC